MSVECISFISLLRTSAASLALTAIALTSTATAQSPRKAPATSPKQTVATQPDSAKLDEMAKEAEAARNGGNTKRAVEIYEEILKARPSWAEGWWYLGTLQYDSDQYQKAIPAFERVIKLEPKLGAAWAFLGLCEFESGNLKGALPHLQQAHNIGVNDAAAARVGDYHLAILLNLNGKFDEAATVLVAQFGQEQLTPQIATAMGLSLLHMPMLPTQLDISKKELVFTAGQALSRMSRKQYAEALDLLQPLEKEYPAVPYLKYSSALALVSLKRTDEAVARLQAEIEIAANPEPYLLLAKIYIERNATADALKAAQQAETLQPESPYAHSLLAECYAQMGNRAEAAREFSLAESFGLPKSSATSTTQNVAAASASGTPEPDARFAEIERRVAAARQANDADAEAKAYRDGLELRPDWAEGLLYLGTIYYGTERYSDALAVAKRLVKLQPGVGTAWAMLGLCEFQLANFDDALVHLSRGRSLGFPQGGSAVSEANYHVGILLNWRGEFDAARSLLLQEATGGPRAADAKFALGISLLRLKQLPSQIKDDQRQMVETAGEIAMDLSRSDYGPACAKFDELLKLYPDRSYIYNAYGWTLLSISRFDAAVEQYRHQLQVDPNAADGYLGLATAAIKTNNLQQAQEAAAKAVQLDPTSAMAHGQLGRAMVGLNELDKGIAELESAVHLAVQIPELHYALSRAYAKANRPKDAERERQIFLRLTKDTNKK